MAFGCPWLNNCTMMRVPTGAGIEDIFVSEQAATRSSLEMRKRERERVCVCVRVGVLVVACVKKEMESIGLRARRMGTQTYKTE